jgi:glycerol-3-phosphate dehydrogenase (NAD(P)+)
MRIAIVGAGAWGTALSVALARAHEIRLWARSPVLRAALQTRRRSSYLPGIELAAAVAIPDDLGQCCRDAQLVILATPTDGLRAALRELRDGAVVPPLVWACKGFERATLKLPHQIVREELGAAASAAALSGPSFALEVAQGLPTALALASDDIEFARETARVLHQRTLRVYFTGDLLGVEIGGAVKNVMAIATGISDGLGLGNNARAALITRGLAELTRLGVALGGRVETCMGLTGAGDLVLTCTGDLSRNRRVGLALAAGGKLEQILASLGHVAEGVGTAQSLARIAADRGVDMPITGAVARVLAGELAPRAAVEELLARDPKAEA